MLTFFIGKLISSQISYSLQSCSRIACPIFRGVGHLVLAYSELLKLQVIVLLKLAPIPHLFPQVNRKDISGRSVLS
jgi:hypothetical protein